MPDSGENPQPPDGLSEELVDQLDSLDAVDLKAVRAYVDARIRSIRPAIEAEIEADAAGEVIEVDGHGGDALVRIQLPESDRPGPETDIVALYHVTREPQLDGSTSLHWSYLGDVQESDRVACQSCGRPIARDSTACPHCGSTDGIDTDTATGDQP